MDFMTIIFSFIFGAIIGSFLNVVSLRFNTGWGINGRSKCMSCGKTLTWKELVPIWSFLYQKGSCKKCKSKISWQYPLVEFVTGLLFALIISVYPPLTPAMAARTILYLIITCLLMVISIYDIKHKIIPDIFSYSFAFLAVIAMFIGGSSWFHIPSLSILIAGPILALPFALIAGISRQKWMGMGDAYLIVSIGWLLGLGAGLNALVLAFWIAAIVSVLWLLVAYKKIKPRTEIPFGPYLILGMYLVLLFHIQVIDLGLVKILWLSYF